MNSNRRYFFKMLSLSLIFYSFYYKLFNQSNIKHFQKLYSKEKKSRKDLKEAKDNIFLYHT